MNKTLNIIVNIIKSIVSVVLIIISLAFIFIEGRLLLSLDWIAYNSPFMSFIMYFCRFLAALIIGVIGVLEIINLFKKNNKLSLIILFSNIGLVIMSIIVFIGTTNYVDVVAIILGLIILLIELFGLIINHKVLVELK